MAKTLPELRNQIDAVDLELITLLNKRAALAHEVGDIKRLDGSAVFRPDRENQVIGNLQAVNQGPLKDHSVAIIWREIMSACRALKHRSASPTWAPPALSASRPRSSFLAAAWRA